MTLTPGLPPPLRPGSARSILHRSAHRAVAGGVCAGIAEGMGVPVGLLRAAVVLATLLGGGLGVAVYIVLWAVLPVDESGPAEPLSPAGGATPITGQPRRHRMSVHHWLVVLGLMVFGAGISLGTEVGSWVTDARYAVPVLAIAAGALVAWYQLDAGGPRRRARSAWVGVAQVIGGLLLVTFGVVVLVTRGQSPQAVWNGALAAVAVLGGALVIAAPFGLRMYRGLQREQLARVRETERADIAAHLHDSVLQTLALIQRRSDDPSTVQRLARRQERELRAWLYGAAQQATDSLAAALAEQVHEVEDEHGVPVELVVTGDRVLDEAGTMLMRATREAVLNAVRHGRPPVSVYVEAGRGGVEVFVRDHGVGFDLDDLDSVADDRMGVRESILGRMERAGGTARIRRLENGTEVSLTLPPPLEPDLDLPTPDPAEPAEPAVVKEPTS